MKGDYILGLDMYIKRVSKLSPSEADNIDGLRAEDLSRNYIHIKKDEFDANADMYSDLIPFISEINLIVKQFNEVRFFEDFDVDPMDIVCGSMFSPEEIHYSLRSGKNICISKEEYESYIEDVCSEVYVWKSEVVAYWRNNHDLDDFLQTTRVFCRAKELIDAGERPSQELMETWFTENCGYYQLSVPEKEALLLYLEDNDDENCGTYSNDWDTLIRDPKSDLFYFAWW